MNAYFNKAEQRVKRLYDFYHKNIMPWQWDYESYSGTAAKRKMVGFFYPEDIANIVQIDYLISQRAGK